MMRSLTLLALTLSVGCARNAPSSTVPPAAATSAEAAREAKPETGLAIALQITQESATVARIDATLTASMDTGDVALRMLSSELRFDGPSTRTESSLRAGDVRRWSVRATRVAQSSYGARVELLAATTRAHTRLGEATVAYAFGERDPAETRRTLVRSAEGDEWLSDNERLTLGVDGQRIRESIVP